MQQCSTHDMVDRETVVPSEMMVKQRHPPTAHKYRRPLGNVDPRCTWDAPSKMQDVLVTAIIQLQLDGIFQSKLLLEVKEYAHRFGPAEHVDRLVGGRVRRCYTRGRSISPKRQIKKSIKFLLVPYLNAESLRSFRVYSFQFHRHQKPTCGKD